MKLIDVTELARKIKSTVRTVYVWVSMQRIPPKCVVKIGRKLLFDEEAINNWLEECRKTPNSLNKEVELCLLEK